MSPMPEPKRDPEALGPCGCVDYHMADCPIRTDAYKSTWVDPVDPDEFYDQPDIDWD